MYRFLIRKEVAPKYNDIIDSMVSDMLIIQRLFFEQGIAKEDIVTIENKKNLCLLRTYLTKYYSYPRRLEHGIAMQFRNKYSSFVNSYILNEVVRFRNIEDLDFKIATIKLSLPESFVIRKFLTVFPF